METSRPRRKLALSLALVATLLVAGAAVAATADTTPETQSHGHGVWSSWTVQWGGPAPIDVRFDTDYYNLYGNDIYYWLNVGAGSDTVKDRWFPCTTTTFTQRLRAVDNNSNVAVDWTTATESGGSFC